MCKTQGWNLILAFPAIASKRDWCERLIAGGCQVYFLPNKASVFAYAWSLARIGLSTNASLIHTHFSLYDVAAWSASFLLSLGKRQLRVVWHVHSDFADRLTIRRRIKNLLKYRIMGNSVRIVAVSEDLRKQIVQAGFKKKRIKTLHNGIDVIRVLEATKTRAQICDEFHIPPEKKILLLFGWTPSVKGVDIAIDAVQRLVGLGLPVVLVIVGTIALQKFVSNYTNEIQPSWLYIIPPTDDVANLYQAASIFLSASRSEGSPYSICEAMISNLPVVLSDLPGITWAHKSAGARFFSSEDSVAMANAICEVLNWNAKERAQNTGDNKHLINTELTISTWTNRMIMLYKEILEKE